MSHLEIDDMWPEHTNAMARHKRLALLGTLLALLLISPVVDDAGPGGVMLSALFTVVLIVGAVALAHVRRDWLVVLSLALPWTYLTWLHPAWSGSALDEVAGAILAACTLYMAAVLLRSVVQAKTVDRDVIGGAIAVYLLIGIAWAVIYVIIEGLSPGSFGLSDADGGTIWIQMLYFSFTTLTTLGYGDVLPLGSVARIWAVLEAITGTFFLAILISRLVGLYRS